MRTECGRKTAFVLALTCCISAAAPRAQAAAAQKLAVVARGIGPGSDKAAALVGHYAHDALDTDERFELVNVTQALGNAERDRALHHFTVAEGLFQKAKEAYARLDLDVADDALRSCLSRYERHAGYVRDYKKVAEALMLLGAVRILRGDERMGQNFLEQALIAYPAIEPDPRIFNPAMRAQFSQTATHLGSRSAGVLALSTSPGAAAAYVDGRFVGVTPVVVESLAEGRHYVRVERDGYRPWGKVLAVGANGETSDSAVLKPTLHFEEFDALLERGARSLEGDPGDQRNVSVAELCRLLGADQVLLAEVRLDGERVRIVADQDDGRGRRGDKPAQHVFAYEPRLEVYEREVGLLLRNGFGYGQPAASSAAAEASAKPHAKEARDKDLDRVLGAALPHAGSRSKVTKQVLAASLTTVGVGAMVGGGVEWALAKRTHGTWRKMAQTQRGQLAMRAHGRNQALLGDVLMGAGVAATLAGVLTWTLWHPDVSVADVLREPVAPAPSAGGSAGGHRVSLASEVDFTLNVQPTLHGALVLPTWSF